jgi:transcription termination/antitermination protein NusG
MEVWSKKKDRKKNIFIPIFPGYLFVDASHLDSETKLSILKTSGVVCILGKNENAEPVPVPANTIDTISRLLNKKVEIFSLQFLSFTEPAKIIDSPFAGIEGTVISSDISKELFVVSIELLQRSVAIKLEGFQIAKI